MIDYVGYFLGEVMVMVRQCFSWFSRILYEIGGLPYVIAALIFVAVISLLLMPLRGGRSIDTGPLHDISVRSVARKVRTKRKED